MLQILQKRLQGIDDQDALALHAVAQEGRPGLTKIGMVEVDEHGRADEQRQQHTDTERDRSQDLSQRPSLLGLAHAVIDVVARRHRRHRPHRYPKPG